MAYKYRKLMRLDKALHDRLVTVHKAYFPHIGLAVLGNYALDFGIDRLLKVGIQPQSTKTNKERKPNEHI
jgi:hypothetical protein